MDWYGEYIAVHNVTEKSAGSYRLTVCYINGSVADRTLDVSVNDGPAIVLHAPSMGRNWHVLGTLSVTVHLNAGKNTIQFSNPSASAPDIDRTVVSS